MIRLDALGQAGSLDHFLLEDCSCCTQSICSIGAPLQTPCSALRQHFFRGCLVAALGSVQRQQISLQNVASTTSASACDCKACRITRTLTSLLWHFLQRSEATDLLCFMSDPATRGMAFRLTQAVFIYLTVQPNLHARGRCRKTCTLLNLEDHALTLLLREDSYSALTITVQSPFVSR